MPIRLSASPSSGGSAHRRGPHRREVHRREVHRREVHRREVHRRGASPRGGLPLFVAAVAVAPLAGCGPSFEAIQEGDLRFAHCDRLDLDPKIAPSHRLHCWREWQRIYTYGQTRDRVEYAQRRIAEVVSGDTGPSFELPADDPPPRTEPLRDESRRAKSRSSYRVARSPEVSRSTGDAVESSDPGSGACQARCRGDLQSCHSGCEATARSCLPCKPAYEQCVQQCSARAPEAARVPEAG